MNKKELKEIIKVYSFEVNWLKNKNKQLEKDKEELQKQLTLTDVVLQGEQIQALEELKEWCYVIANESNNKRLYEILDRL